MLKYSRNKLKKVKKFNKYHLKMRFLQSPINNMDDNLDLDNNEISICNNNNGNLH